MPEEPLTGTYTVVEVAEILGIGKNSAYDAARRGDFPVIRLGSQNQQRRSPFRRYIVVHHLLRVPATRNRSKQNSNF